MRSQLERVQSDKAEDSSTKSTDAIKRLQKQLREAREEQQESERKEQEQNKKRRLMVKIWGDFGAIFWKNTCMLHFTIIILLIGN